MGASLNASGTGFLYINSGALDDNNAYAVMCWMRLRENAGGGDNCLIMFNNGFFGNYEYANTGSDGETLGIGANTGSDTDGAIPINTWFHICLTRTATNGTIEVYVNGVLVADTASNATGRSTADLFNVGGIAFVGQITPIDVAYMRAFAEYRDAPAIAAEMNSPTVIDGTAIYGEWLFPNDGNFLADTSGEGNHWGTIGTPLWVDDPVLAPPPSGVSIPVILHHLRQQGIA